MPMTENVWSICLICRPIYLNSVDVLDCHVLEILVLSFSLNSIGPRGKRGAGHGKLRMRGNSGLKPIPISRITN